MTKIITLPLSHSCCCSCCLCLLLLLLTHHFLGIASAFASPLDSTISTAASRSITTTTTTKVTTTTTMVSALSSSTTIDQDVREFHQHAASAVDLTMVHHAASSVNGNIVSVIRSCRNWDADQRQSYLYRFNLQQLLLQNESSAQNAIGAVVTFMPPPIPLGSSVKIYLPSPSGNKTIVVKEEQQPKASGSGGVAASTTTTIATIVEVWHGSSLVKRIPLNNNAEVAAGQQLQHGKIVNDATGFGSPVWSPDETSLLYSAERLPPKTTAFWSSSSKSTTTVNNVDETNDLDVAASSDQAPLLRGGNNVLGVGQRDHWGERYSTQEPILDLYILNLDTGRIGRIQNVPKRFSEEQQVDGDDSHNDESVTLGQAVWHSSGDKVAFTAWNAGLPKRLGMIYCRNRASRIFEASVQNLRQSLATPVEEEGTIANDDTDYVCHSKVLPYARSPRYLQHTNEDDLLVFLGSDRTFVSHDACMGLYMVSSNGKAECMVPIVDHPKEEGPKVFGMGFPGLFLGQLPVQCSLKGGSNDYMVTTSLFGSVQRVLRIDCSTREVSVVTLPQLDETTSQSLSSLSREGDLILSVTSSTEPVSLWFVKAGNLEKEAVDGKVTVEGREIIRFAPIAASAYSTIKTNIDASFKMKVLSTVPPDVDGATNAPIQSILLLPKTASSSQPVPLVVIPHGGPHSCSTSSFAPGFAHLASKYAILFPNYRGSIGFGQASADSLLTRIGDVDVKDVMESTKHAMETTPEIDNQNVGICGGSHGGFLTAHCTSQFPDFFKAAACRNPVTNIASMLTSTDIPDWCFAEAFGEYDQTKYQGPSKEQIAAMYEKSPMSRVDQVKTPTLIALGKVDLRVPYSQGLEWYHSLRSKGVPTKLLLYPKDCHALDRDTTEADHWIHIRQWFDQYFER